jgi:hypothetical protein
MVISMPKRISIAAGVSQIMIDSPSVSAKRLLAAGKLARPRAPYRDVAPSQNGGQREDHESGLMIFMRMDVWACRRVGV